MPESFGCRLEGNREEYTAAFQLILCGALAPRGIWPSSGKGRARSSRGGDRKLSFNNVKGSRYVREFVLPVFQWPTRTQSVESRYSI